MSTLEPSARDWPEDFQHENGNYICFCVNCGNTFFGYKRRMICKTCTKPEQQKAKEVSV